MPATAHNKPWLPYVLPMGIYLAFLAVQTNANLAWLYPVKIAVVAAALLWFRRRYVELAVGADRRCWDVQGILLAIGVGLAAIVVWIGLDPWYPKLPELLAALERGLAVLWREPPPPPSVPAGPFDPRTLGSPAATWTFIGFRVLGAVVVVAFMEELFWRGFLLRWLIDEDFQKVPVGTFTGPSFLITVLMFGVEHNEWLPGLVCGALYNGLLYRRKDLRWCVLAHAVSNATLAAWVLARGDWKFW